MRCNIHDFDIMEEAKAEAKLEYAQKMLLKHIGTIEQIAEITGLPEEKIKELSEDLKIEA